MPRATRAAQRSNAIVEDEPNLAMSVPLPLTPQPEREPLVEVANNLLKEQQTGADDGVKVGKKGAKGKTAKGAKKGKSQPKAVNDDPNPEVLEDVNTSATSSAIQEACEELMKASTGGNYG